MSGNPLKVIFLFVNHFSHSIFFSLAPTGAAGKSTLECQGPILFNAVNYTYIEGLDPKERSLAVTINIRWLFKVRRKT